MMFIARSFKLVLYRVCLTVAAATLACGTCTIAATRFHGLGDLSGGMIASSASAVSADGFVVVGSSESVSGTEAFRWTLADGLMGIGDLPGGDFNSIAYGVSADGSVIVGDSDSVSGPEAFRWTSSDGMTGLGDLPGGAFSSVARDVSADGSVVVGTSDFGGGARLQAFRWTQSDGMVALGWLFDGSPTSSAGGVSADGSIVVGGSTTLEGDGAFRWTHDTGMTQMPGDHMTGLGLYDATATAVSSDGVVIVGRSNTIHDGSQAYLWTENDEWTGLGILPGYFSTTALDVSTDGNVIVGFIQPYLGSFTAFIWNPIDGMQPLQSVLTGLGLDLTGWTLETATGISDDGLTIVGTGINPNGDTEAFIARLPEPGTLTAFGLGVTALLRRRRTN